MDAEYDNDNSSTDSFIELINMQTSIIITKDNGIKITGIPLLNDIDLIV